MTIWQFTVKDRHVTYGASTHRLLTLKGCNEPFKDRYWCPQKRWFAKEICPFINRRECENFIMMSGEQLARPLKAGKES